MMLAPKKSVIQYKIFLHMNMKIKKKIKKNQYVAVSGNTLVCVLKFITDLNRSSLREVGIL